MSAETRTISVTVEVTERYHAVTEIDASEYLEWLDGDEDTTETLTEFLRGGDVYGEVESVVRLARDNGASEVWHSDIVEAVSA